MSAVHPAVRVKVKKCEVNGPPEWRKFSVDPQLTTLETLYSLLAKAFEIKFDFSIKYKAFDPAGNEIYLPVLSDWDLDAAFLRIHNISIQTETEPCLILQIDVKPFTIVKAWEVETPSNQAAINSTTTCSSTENTRDIVLPLQQSFGMSHKYVQNMQTKLPGLIINQMEKTFSIVQKAFNLSEETMASLPPRAPLSDNEFRLFLDAVGQIQRTDELRKVIFLGGIDPSLRRVVWKHLLNVYPNGMNGHQRMEYMRKKAETYYKLRDSWKMAINQGCIIPEISYVTSMVKKDVLRTDRLHSFYSGTDDNKNIASLFNILTTYALNHPSVSYCQGMSDIASPLLVTMNDEAQAYICFCGIMNRVKGNFMLDGIAMTQKFAHLTEALSFYDPEFWDYLKSQQADDLLFCYRWLLLELKREFPFDDALRMLEVQWSSLKYEKTLNTELSLYEKEFKPNMEKILNTSNSSSFDALSSSYLVTKAIENPYTKVCEIRRQSSTASLNSISSSLASSSKTSHLLKKDSTKRLNQSLDDSAMRHVSRRQRHSSSKAHQSLDETKMQMLMETVENVSFKQIKCMDQLRTNEITDEIEDNVFLNNESTQELYRLNFHPTNPFKDDAQNSVEKSLLSQSSPKEENAKTVARVFLSSTSSSITEDGNDESDIKIKSPQMPTEIAKLQNKNIISNYDAVVNIIAKQRAFTDNTNENIKRTDSIKGGHFRGLKEKIAATSKLGLCLDDYKSNNKSEQKLVKNFNEFLNFSTANKNRNSDIFSTVISTVGSDAKCETEHNTLLRLSSCKVYTSLNELESLYVPRTACSDLTDSSSTHPHGIAKETITDTNDVDLIQCSVDQDQCSLQKLNNKEIKLHSINSSKLSKSDNDDQEPTVITCDIRLETENLFRHTFEEMAQPKCIEIEYEKLGRDSFDLVHNRSENKIIKDPVDCEVQNMNSSHSSNKTNIWEDEFESSCEWNSNGNIKIEDNVQVNTTTPITGGYYDNPFIDNIEINGVSDVLKSINSYPEEIVPTSTELKDVAADEMATNASDEIELLKSINSPNVTSNPPYTPPNLPSPTEFGGGNPFLIFLCLTLLLQHRNTIMKSGMDYNEIAMHFDKMVRKHDVTRVLNQARRMYIDYLKTQNSYKQKLQNFNASNGINKISNNASHQS